MWVVKKQNSRYFNVHCHQHIKHEILPIPVLHPLKQERFTKPEATKLNSLHTPSWMTGAGNVLKNTPKFTTTWWMQHQNSFQMGNLFTFPSPTLPAAAFSCWEPLGTNKQKPIHSSSSFRFYSELTTFWNLWVRNCWGPQWSILFLLSLHSLRHLRAWEIKSCRSCNANPKTAAWPPVLILLNSRDNNKWYQGDKTLFYSHY